MLHPSNICPSNVENIFVGYDAHEDFSNGINNDIISVLYSDSGILGMFDAP